jgi:hypothetical protein
MPRETCRIVFELNLAIDGPLRHRLDDGAAEAPPLWRPHGWPVALDPSHLEEVASNLPMDVHPAGSGGQ